MNNAFLDWADAVNVLKLLPRTGWLLNGVTPCESVADHTCATALVAMWLAAQINADWAAADLTQPLDVGRVAQIALLHDLAESVLTDLPKRATALLGAEVKHAAEETILADLCRSLPDGAMYVELWREYAAASSPEARLVRDADKLEMVHQALYYARRGHRTLDEFWEDHRWFYGLSATLFETLHQMDG